MNYIDIGTRIHRQFNRLRQNYEAYGNSDLVATRMAILDLIADIRQDLEGHLAYPHVVHQDKIYPFPAAPSTIASMAGTFKGMYPDEDERAHASAVGVDLAVAVDPAVDVAVPPAASASGQSPTAALSEDSSPPPAVVDVEVLDYAVKVRAEGSVYFKDWGLAQRVLNYMREQNEHVYAEDASKSVVLNGIVITKGQ